MKAPYSLVLLIVLAVVPTEAAPRSQSNFTPISEDGLMELLANKIPRAALIRVVNTRGVAFQLTSWFEKDLSKSAQYLGPSGLNALLTALGANFRPPLVRPYRLTYRLLRGRAVDLLLDGKIGRWEKGLDGKYFIVQNQVFKTLSELVTRFSEEFDDQHFVRIGGPRRKSRRLADQYRDNEKRVFVGSSGDDYIIDNNDRGLLEAKFGSLYSGGTPGVASFVNSLNDSSENWTFYGIKENRLNILTFTRFAKKGDLDAFDPESKLKDFYAFVTQDYMPADFGVVEVILDERIVEDGCEHHGRSPAPLAWAAHFYGPLLRLNVAIIENVSNEPIRVGRFILRESKSSRLQTRSAVRDNLASQTPQRDDLFSPGILRPGESLVVPVELSFRMETRDLRDLFGFPGKQGSNYYNEMISRARATKGLSFTDHDGEELPTVRVEALERIIKDGRVDITSPVEYIYGPSVSIDSLEINKFGYLIRKFDPAKLLISSGFDQQDVGSCPYVYTYSTGTNSWLKEGVILKGRDSELKESTDEIPLNRFNGSVLIRERDPEDSFIDSLYIRALSSDGKETIIYPDERKLRIADGDYLHLRQGDQFTVNFQVPYKLRAQKYFLVASGYYIPYNARPAGVRTRARMKTFRAAR